MSAARPVSVSAAAQFERAFRRAVERHPALFAVQGVSSRGQWTAILAELNRVADPGRDPERYRHTNNYPQP